MAVKTASRRSVRARAKEELPVRPDAPTVERMLADMGDGDYVAAVLETYKRVMDVYGPTQQDAPPLVGDDISVNGLSTTTNIYFR